MIVSVASSHRAHDGSDIRDCNFLLRSSRMK
jgi:hypothetical protein